jgi:hypothetical protein
MKKSFVILLSLGSLSSFAVSSANYNCSITSIGDLYLSEKYSEDYKLEVEGGTYSLSDEVRSDISVEPYGFLTDISIGDDTFDYQNTVINETKSLFNAKIEDTDKSNSLLLNIYKKTGLGVLLGKNLKDTSFKMIATFDCNNYSKEKSKILKSDTEKLKEIQFEDIPRNVLNTMSAVDLGFEMGDGYYDVLVEKIFAVTTNGKTVGYIVESEMTYTEDPDEIIVYNYYLANGIRFSSDIWDY